MTESKDLDTVPSRKMPPERHRKSFSTGETPLGKVPPEPEAGGGLVRCVEAVRPHEERKERQILEAAFEEARALREQIDSVDHDQVPWHNKLVIATVGLPARGKSYISHKLVNFLCWSGIESEIFNAGKTRRRLLGTAGGSNCAFFEAKQDELRERIAFMTLDKGLILILTLTLIPTLTLTLTLTLALALAIDLTNCNSYVTVKKRRRLSDQRRGSCHPRRDEFHQREARGGPEALRGDLPAAQRPVCGDGVRQRGNATEQHDSQDPKLA